MKKELLGTDKDIDNEMKNVQTEDFVYTMSDAQIKKYLSYIHEWKGLTQSSVLPDNVIYKDYQNKARNWLNGRRSKKYGNSLFYDMFLQCDQV